MKYGVLAVLMLWMQSAVANVSYDDCMYLADIGYTAAVMKDQNETEAAVVAMFQDPEWAPNPHLKINADQIIRDVFHEPELANVTGREINLMVYAKCNW